MVQNLWKSTRNHDVFSAICRVSPRPFVLAACFVCTACAASLSFCETKNSDGKAVGAISNIADDKIADNKIAEKSSRNKSAKNHEKNKKNPALDASKWDALVKLHINERGGVDYSGFQKDRARLDEFIATYASFPFQSASESVKKSAYINLYNAFMIQSILNYAGKQGVKIESKEFLQIKIDEIKVEGGNIWNGDYKTSVAGTMLNLDGIEHGLLRGKMENPEIEKIRVKELDPRIHAAVNCAAISCPKVRRNAFTSENLETMLNENMQLYLSSSKHFKKLSDSKIQANSIVFWYYSDFDDFAQQKLKLRGAGDYLAQFVDPKSSDSAWKIKHLRENFNDRSQVTLKLSSAFTFDYKWLVNDARQMP